MRRFAVTGVAAAAATVAIAVAADTARPTGWHHEHGHEAGGKLLFFASDGMREDAVKRYADQGVVPGFRDMLRHGAFASHNGLLTQAPPNTGAGWYTLATGAWPGAHGSTNNTFHINGGNFDFGTSFSSPAALQAETLAQSAERAGKKVAQIEWVGGRVGAINGPTLDFRTFVSGRGVATNYTSPTDLEGFVRSFRVQYDHPNGYAGNAPFPQASPSPATGLTDTPR